MADVINDPIQTTGLLKRESKLPSKSDRSLIEVGKEKERIVFNPVTHADSMPVSLSAASLDGQAI
jgi:hypothetical protein